MSNAPVRAARYALAVVLLSVCFLDYGAYREAFHVAPNSWMDVAAGTANAPEQYRIGVVRLALWMTQHTPLHLQHAFALIDTVCALGAGFVLLRVLERSVIFARASAAMQWLGTSVFVGLITFYLLWLISPQKPETLPATMFAALLLWLWQPGETPSRHSFFRVLALVAVTLLLSLVRADVAFAVSVGVFVVTLLPAASELSVSRGVACSTSLMLVAIAGGTQWWLMRVVYPAATYGRVKPLQLLPNLHHATRWPGFILFLLPVAWTVVQVARQKFVQDAASLAMLVGAAIYFVLWVTFGKIDEVRIFLPLAVALVPLTVQMLLLPIELANFKRTA